MSGAAGIVYGKAAIEGKETASDTSGTDVDGILTIYGYPMATDAGIEEAVVGLAEDWAQLSPAVASNATYYFKGATAPTSNTVTTGCYVNYQQASSSAAPVIRVESEGC